LHAVSAAWPTTLVSDAGRDAPITSADGTRLHRVTRAELHQRLSTGRDAATVPLYVSGDPADDVFQALAERGIGILVTLIPAPTAARYSLQDAIEVRELLARLVAWKGEHAEGAGTGDPGQRH
jgi:hypothetical protein